MITSKEGGEDAAWANRAGRRAQRMQKRALTWKRKMRKSPKMWKEVKEAENLGEKKTGGTAWQSSDGLRSKARRGRPHGADRSRHTACDVRLYSLCVTPAFRAA